MKELKDTLDLVIKFGVIPILMINVWWLNSELGEVKERMYDCFEDKETILRNRTTNNNEKKEPSLNWLVAVLPSSITTKKENKDDRAN